MFFCGGPEDFRHNRVFNPLVLAGWQATGDVQEAFGDSQALAPDNRADGIVVRGPNIVPMVDQLFAFGWILGGTIRGNRIGQILLPIT